MYKNIRIYLSYLMQILIVVYSIISLYFGEYLLCIWSLFAFVLTLAPMIIKRKYNVTLSWELNFLIVLILYLHIGGNVRGWYDLFYPFYDKFMHLLSSALVAIFGFVSTVILTRYVDSIKFNRYLTFFFVIVMTMAFGAFWEIGEFFSDILLNTQLQYGLTDTMLDLIFDLICCSMISIIRNFYSNKISKLKHNNYT